MTKLKSIISVFVFAVIASTVFANSVTSETQTKLRKEIAKHLQDIDLSKYDVEEATIQLTFMVNNQNEIVVLSTNNSKFDRTLKNKLNYKEIRATANTANQIYFVPITLKS